MLDLDNISNSQIAHVIDEYIHNERDREILKHRLIDGYTYSKLGDMYYPLSERQIQNIVYKGEKKIFRQLGI